MRGAIILLAALIAIAALPNAEAKRPACAPVDDAAQGACSAAIDTAMNACDELFGGEECLVLDHVLPSA